MKRDFIYLPVIVALVIFVSSQEVRMRRLTEANVALQSGMVIRSHESQKLSEQSASSKDKSKEEEKNASPRNTASASSQKAYGAEISIEEGMSRERSLKIRQRVDARILAWKGVLNLSETQKIQLRAAMEMGEQKLEHLSRSRTGKGAPSKAYLEEGAALQMAQDEAIKTLLSEDQRVALEQQKSRELQTQAEVKAGEQMAKLQDNLILTEEQKDAAFQMYAQQALVFDPMKIIREGREPAVVMEEQRQASKEQLQQILTPEQYKLFIGQEEERAALKRERGF